MVPKDPPWTFKWLKKPGLNRVKRVTKKEIPAFFQSVFETENVNIDF